MAYPSLSLIIAVFLLILTFKSFAMEEELKKLMDARGSDSNPADQSQAGQLIDWGNMPRLFIAGDLIYEKDIKGDRPGSPERPAKNSLDLRELEFGFRGAVDHIAEATVLFALHRETHDEHAGSYNIDIHSAYLDFTRLPANLHLRLGKMFLDAGRLNTMHRHDWHFSHAPVIHELIFNDLEVGEGASDIGAELSYLMPWTFFQELKAGVFRGKSFGHSHEDEVDKKHPLYTLRLKNFIPLGNLWGTQFGFSYLRYNNTDASPAQSGDLDHTYGLDLTLKYEKGRQASFIWTSEYWYKKGERENHSKANVDQGFYSYIQYQQRHWAFGLRYDFAERSSFAAPDFAAQKPRYDGQSAWITWQPSEFSFYRLSLARHNPNADFDHPRYSPGKEAFSLTAQAVFMLGYHPAHQY